MKKIPIAIQLYSLREEAAKDFIGALEKVAEMGYEGVEFAGYGGIPADEMKAALDRLNLKVAGTHVDMKEIFGQPDEVIAYCKTIGCQNVILPWGPVGLEGGVKVVVDGVMSVVKKYQDNGMKLLYHNHDGEFQKEGEEYALDVLYNSFDHKELQAEYDVFWVTVAGEKPYQYLIKNADKVAVIHLKDGIDMAQTPVGNGAVDIAGAVKAGYEIGVEWFVVEADDPVPTPFEFARISIDNLKNKFNA